MENNLQQPLKDVHLAKKNLVYNSGKSTLYIFGCLNIHKTMDQIFGRKKKTIFQYPVMSLSLGAFHAQEVVVPWPAEGPLTALLSCLSGFDTWMCLPLRKWFRMFRTMCNGYTQVAHGIFTDIFILHTYIFYPYCILSKGV